MIISRLDGGLGNQMFQYAYGRYLAQQHGTQLLLDCSSYAQQPVHGFLLDRFCITADLVDDTTLSLVPRRYRPSQQGAQSGPAWNIRHFLDGLTRPSLVRHKERPFGFQPRHLHVPDQRFLVGYWQSEQYFPGMRAGLLDEFQLKQAVSQTSQRVGAQIRDCNSAAIHVRRGDYIHDPAAASIYEHLDLDYYRMCLEHWAATTSSPEIFVFSNDIEWCRRELNLPWTTHWVDHNDADRGHEDMWLMSQAACCVIANSTFSWWAAWLNQRSQRVVYAPSNWFRPGTLDGTQIIPQGWLRMAAGRSPVAA